MLRSLHPLAFGAIAIVTFSAAAQGALIIDAAAVTSSDNSEAQFAPAINLINNSGLSSNLATPGTSVSYPASFPTVDPNDSHTNGGSFGDYRGNNRAGASTLTFTLDQAYDLTSLYVYNYTELFPDANGTYYNGRGTQTASLSYSTNDGISYTALPGTLTLPEAPSTTTYMGDNVSLGTTLAGVTNVQLSLLTNYGTPGDGSFIGLSELRFVGDLAAPEPATLAMLSIGAMGLLTRRVKT